MARRKSGIKIFRPESLGEAILKKRDLDKDKEEED
jgi:hypothetical protein